MRLWKRPSYYAMVLLGWSALWSFKLSEEISRVKSFFFFFACFQKFQVRASSRKVDAFDIRNDMLACIILIVHTKKSYLSHLWKVNASFLNLTVGNRNKKVEWKSVYQRVIWTQGFNILRKQFFVYFVLLPLRKAWFHISSGAIDYIAGEFMSSRFKWKPI